MPPVAWGSRSTGADLQAYALEQHRKKAAQPPDKKTAVADMHVRLERVAAPASNSKISVGIVCMTKQPMDLIGWLEHHRRLGVLKFYLRIEGTPSLATLLAEPPWSGLVESTFASNTCRDYIHQTARQNAHVASAIPRARLAGLTHILHIDDDEVSEAPSARVSNSHCPSRSLPALLLLHFMTGSCVASHARRPHPPRSWCSLPRSCSTALVALRACAPSWRRLRRSHPTATCKTSRRTPRATRATRRFAAAVSVPFDTTNDHSVRT